jgi:hypothetical protein
VMSERLFHRYLPNPSWSFRSSAWLALEIVAETSSAASCEYSQGNTRGPHRARFLEYLLQCTKTEVPRNLDRKQMNSSSIEGRYFIVQKIAFNWHDSKNHCPFVGTRAVAQRFA